MLNRVHPGKGISFSILSLFLSITVTFLSEAIFDDLKSGVLIGLLTLLVTSAFEIKESIRLHSNEIQASANSNRDEVIEAVESHKYESSSAAEKIVTLLRVHNEYFLEIGLFEMLNTIIDIRKIAQQRRHDLVRFNEIITSAIEKAKSEIGREFSINTKDDELNRIVRLNEIVSTSEQYIYAVTYDEDDYLNNFWNAVFGREYIDSNLDAISREVKVERIFVIDEKIINGENLSSRDQGTRKKLLTVSKALQPEEFQRDEKCKVYWVSKESLPNALKEYSTSFLVSDDLICSESNGVYQGEEVSGYVSYGDRSRVVPLKERFERMRQYAEEIYA
jgi:hypothetical protein